jgi:hypothetical protein
MEYRPAGVLRTRQRDTPDGQRHAGRPLVASVSFHLDPAQVETPELLAAEIGRQLADAALAVVPQRIGT